MKTAERWLVIAGLLSLSFYHVIFVPWIGRSYCKPPRTATASQVWTPTGGFGLEGEDAGRYQPAWNPPAASGSGVLAVRRWPWQPITHPYHVEVNMLILTARCSASVVGLGLLLAIFNFWNRARGPSVLRSIVYALAASQALTWLATPGLYFFIGPYGLDEYLMTILLSAAAAGAALGCAVACWRTLGHPKDDASD